MLRKEYDKGKLREALKAAGLTDLILDRFVDGLVMVCDESCYSSCSQCCKEGSANRLAAIEAASER
jgi:hypothetical protein